MSQDTAHRVMKMGTGHRRRVPAQVKHGRAMGVWEAVERAVAVQVPVVSTVQCPPAAHAPRVPA